MASQNQLTPIIGVCQARMYLWEKMSVQCAYRRSVTARIPDHHCHSQPQETMVLPTPLRPIHVYWKYYQATHHRDFHIFPQPAHELQVCQRPGASRRLGCDCCYGRASCTASRRQSWAIHLRYKESCSFVTADLQNFCSWALRARLFFSLTRHPTTTLGISQDQLHSFFTSLAPGTFSPPRTKLLHSALRITPISSKLSDAFSLVLLFNPMVLSLADTVTL